MIIDKLKLRKSAGVRVSLPVHAILREANTARETKDHRRAAGLFRKALDRDPTLAHVWVQYGHMLRETDDLDAAESAYGEALRLAPASDPHLHLGHLHKDRGQIGKAARSYLAAARLDPRNGDAMAELHELVARNIEIMPEDIMALVDFDPDHAFDESDPVAVATATARSALDTLVRVLRQGGGDDRLALLETTDALREQLGKHADGLAGGEAACGQGTAIVFDVSDLLSYFRKARLPTGIQRVQIEVIRNALRDNRRETIKVCVFLDSRDEWVEIPRGLFLLLCKLSLESGDRQTAEWIAATTKVQLAATMAEAMPFPRGAFLVNLGTSWWLQNYFLYVRQAKAAYGIHYVPFVHDLIPVKASEHCTKELTQDFISWVTGAFEHADYFFANSEATKRDLIEVAATLGHAVDPDKVVVVRLDADFRKPVAVPLTDKTLSDRGIGRADFALFVSTIESRKNHIGAFDAWLNLIRTHGARRVPKLVCVGNRGWLNDTVYARLASHDALRDRVIMLSGLSDAELDLFYRSCLFTLYPSNYEGWGLPVTESLCYGKVPLISDASSLPEAGGEFAHYFEAGSTARLTAALEQVIFDESFRRDKEDRIRRDFVPRSWGDIATQISAALQRWAQEDAEGEASARSVPVATLGAYHPIVRNFETRIWPGMRSAEIFRAGPGWWGPDNWGCWTKPLGGTLEIGLRQEIDEPVRLYLQLHGLPARDCPWTVTLENGAAQKGHLPSGAFKWIHFDIDPLPRDHVLQITIEGAVSLDLREVTDGSDPRVVSVGVGGFFLCRTKDAEARAAFLEAVALGNLPDLAFNRDTDSIAAAIEAPSIAHG
ncbi:glycosyltransferase [Sphingomonas sp. H39-1-10]|uniref:glycosyltransferase family 4 protein n=1 Tax=Sphingomonas pollutisoli TaxID=3030829 RepID=UPI0023B9F050|nr:glycosyltransferase [Sphingomonas pollutisoli]MDF0490486.1 glycosyltransferase [Sphingomonas pollutisoli]